MMHSILVVEDELDIQALIVSTLELAGFQVLTAQDGHTAVSLARQHLPDVIVLDWMIPKLSGIDVCKLLKKDEQCQTIPIIMLSAKAEEDHRVQGLDAGADDYVAKPFSTRELVSRLNAQLRRLDKTKHKKLELGELIIDSDAQIAFFAGEAIKIGPTEFKLLTFFMKNNGRAFSRGQILDHVWGVNIYVDERTVDVHIGRLRKILEPYAIDHWLQTVRGIGYRFSNSAGLQ